MIRAVILLMIAISATGIVNAQPATPTVLPPGVPALSAGFYAAESPDLQLGFSGTGWVQLVDGDYVVMESATAGDSVSVDVDGAQIVIYRDLMPTGGTAQVCIASACAAMGSASSVDQRSVPIAYTVPPGGGRLVITVVSGAVRIDALLVVAADDLPQMPTDPIREYTVLADGTVVAFDRVVSGTDVVSVALLAALLLVAVVGVLAIVWTKD